ncbi:MAG TPA: methyltransferase domain-containing protein [Pyrinomonadaceae bacterium]
MTGKGFKEGWMDVDADPRHYIHLLDVARGGREDDPAQYRNAFDTLRASEGGRVLDVGCGTGGAARALAASFSEVEQVVGTDISETMIAEARARTEESAAPVGFVLGDAHALPFPDESFDAAYSLRVFEIIGDPRRALSEMARVLRPRGRLAVNGTDIDAWTIDSSYRDVTRRIIHYACDVETNGWVGRQLPAWCKELGLTEVCVTPVGIVVTELGPLYEVCLKTFVENAAEAGAVTPEEAARWVEDLHERDRHGQFFCSQMLFRVSARKESRQLAVGSRQLKGRKV